MNSLPTGMYQGGDTEIHLLRADIKIICFVIFIAAVICARSIPAYAALLVFTAFAVLLSKLPPETVLSPIKRMAWFFAVILLMNTFFFSPDSAWFRFWIFAPSKAGLLQGMGVVVRVLFVLVMGNILTVTTAPLAMTDAVERLLSPLAVLRVPTGQIAMILSVAIQFIPTLFEETDMIRKAQTARGARFDSRKLSEKAMAVMPLAVPVFISAFRRADELSLAMEARGYRTDIRRLRKRGGRPAGRDYAAVFICLALLAGIIVFL